MAGHYLQYPPPPTGAVYQTSPRPSLPRSISTTNLETTKRCRAVIQQDWCSTAPMGGTNFFTSTPCFTLTLPALTDYPPEFQQFVFDRIIDKETQRALESEKCLNWCPSATKLVPIYTLGDGNCLLHAASLGMWGFQDRDYILRRAVSHACSNTAGNTFYRRWQYARELDNTNCGVQLDQDQWQQEWRLVVNQASADVPAAGSLDSLEEFHIFVLANVLRRPVIMYAGPKMRSVQGATLQGVNFHGVYLPLLWDPNSCKKDPLPLSFCGGHFSSLVVVDSPQQYRNGYLVLPLTDYYGQQLPIRFILPQEDPTALLMDYLNLMQIQNHGSPYFPQHAICAKLMIAEIPAYLKPLISGFIDACHDAYRAQGQVQQQQPNQLSGGSRTLSQGGVGDGTPRTPCINNCGMCGDPETAGLCSQCYRKAQTEAQAQERDQAGSRQPYTYSDTPGQRLGGDQPPAQSYQQPPAQASPLSGSLGSIKCPHCANPGHPMYLGMCESCYRRTTQGQQQQLRPPQQQGSPPQQGKGDDTYESLGNFQSPNPQAQSKPPALPPPRPQNASGGRSKCRMPGCEFFGTAETRFYCSKCFNDNLETILKEVEPGPKAPPTLAPPSSYARTQAPQQQFTAPVTGGGTYSQLRGPEPQPYEIPVTSRNPPSAGGGSSQEPPKCPSCKQFYGSEEFGWLCNSCFMKRTEMESAGNRLNPLNNPPTVASSRAYTEPQMNYQAQQQYGQQYQPYHQPSPTPPAYAQIRRCANVGCNNTAGEDSGFCAACNMEQNLPQPAMEFQSSLTPPLQSQQQGYTQQPYSQPQFQTRSPQQKPVPKPRRNLTQIRPATDEPVTQHRGTFTAPVNDLSGAMEKMTVSGTFPCFLCQGTSPGAGGENSYTVCVQHASMMKSMMGTKNQPPGHYSPSHENEMVRQKPTTAPYNYPGSYPEDVVVKQKPAGSSSDLYSQPGFPSPAYGTASVQPGDQYGYGKHDPAYNRIDPTYSQHDPRYPGGSHAAAQSQYQATSTQPYNSPPGGAYGHPQYQAMPSATHQANPPSAGTVPQRQQQQANRFQQNPGMFDTAEEPRRKPYPGVMVSGGGDRGGGDRGVLSSGVGGGGVEWGGSSYGGGGGGGYGGGGSAYGGGGANSEGQYQSEAIGAGAAPGQNRGTDDVKPAKQLCRIPGCSFKAVSELGGFCPDCYDEHYPKRNDTPQR